MAQSHHYTHQRQTVPRLLSVEWFAHARAAGPARIGGICGGGNIFLFIIDSSGGGAQRHYPLPICRAWRHDADSSNAMGEHNDREARGAAAEPYMHLFFAPSIVNRQYRQYRQYL